LVEQGVIDPTKVTKTALINAASVAGLLLTTECAINDIADEKKDANPGMGMM
jgi:chaperonin GroEL